MQAHRALRVLVESFSDLLFPPVCLACGGLLLTGRGRLCDCCAISLKNLERDTALFREISDRLTEGGLVEALVSRFVFEKGTPLQTLLHQLKYGGMTAIGRDLGRHVGANVRAWCGLSPPTVVIPMPLHPAKQRERGYNQSEYIARGIQDATNLPIVINALARWKYTASQTTLDRAERVANVRGAFEIRPRASRMLRGQRILLVDDVITTGSTVRECARVLRGGGAQSVIACSVALAASVP